MRTRLWRSLATQLVVVQLILIAAVLLAVSAVSVEQTRASSSVDQGRRVLALAEYLAATSLIRRGDMADRQRRHAAGRRDPAAADHRRRPGADRRPDGQGAGRHRSRRCWTNRWPWPELLAAPQRASSTAHRAGRSQLPDRRRADPVLRRRRTGPPARHRDVGELNPTRPRRPGRGGAHPDHLPRGRHGAGRRGLPAAGPLDQAADASGWSRPRWRRWPSSGKPSSPGSPRA